MAPQDLQHYLAEEGPEGARDPNRVAADADQEFANRYEEAIERY